MRTRPLCFVCLLFIVIQSIILIATSGASLVDIPASSIFFEQEEQIVSVQGQVYKKSSTSNLQILYLKNNSVYDSKLLIYMENPIDISIGETIALRGTANPFAPATNPGNFDQALHYARQGVYGVIWCDDVIRVSGKVDPFAEGLYQIRTKWKQGLVSHMGESNGTVLAAMLLGEKSEMDAEVKELYQKNGIGHVLAISGLHISFIGLGIYQWIRKTGLGYLPSGILSVSILSLYVLMLGFSVSVFRAYVMLLLRIGADMTGRVYDMLTALMLAAATTVAIEPLYLTDAGFFLSYGAVLGLLLVSPALEKCFPSKGKLLPAFLSSMAVNLALFPVLIWFYFEFPIYSVIWNLFVIPLMSFVLGFGMLGSFLMLWVEPLSRVCFFICNLILDFYEWIGRIGVKLPMAQMVLGQPKIWTVILYYVVLAMILLLVGRMKRKRRLLWFALVPVVLLMGARTSSHLTITMLDVGQGDSIFLRGPKGNTYLIDGGSSDVNQIGKYRLEPFLKSQGIRALDYVFVSHGDIDHCSGIEEMITRQEVGVKIRCLVMPANYRQDEMLTHLASAAGERGISVAVIQAGQYLEEDTLQITCIQPEEREGLGGNAGSMVLEVSCGDFSMLFTGDVEYEGEELLISKIQGKDYDVLKVAHHGSRNSTSPVFLETAKPEIALISSGGDNRYRHPHEETLERLENAGCQIYQTIKSGAITLITDGNSLTISLLPFRL